MFRFVEFYGCGAGTLAASNAGLIPIACICKDKWEAEMVKANLPIATFVGIRELDTRTLPQFDVCHVGELGKDLDAWLKIIDKTTPRVVTYSPLSPHQRDQVLPGLENLGYISQSDQYDAFDFGMPQYSSRDFYVFRRATVRLGEYFPFPDPPPRHGNTFIADIMEKECLDSGLWLTEEELSQKRAQDEKNKRGNFCYNTHIVHGNEVLSAVPTNYHKHYRILLSHHCDTGQGLRRFTPTEIARAQGFPLKWKIPVPKTRAFPMAGRSAWPPVLEAIYRELREWLP